jgi:hypothetical protein
VWPLDATISIVALAYAILAIKRGKIAAKGATLRRTK